MYLIIGLLCLGIVLVLVIRWLLKAIGVNCHICGRKTMRFEELDEGEQGELSGYFHEYEEREPETDKVFACRHCRIVYDEFSGEHRSREGDDLSICKICNAPYVRYIGEYVGTPMMTQFRKVNPNFEKWTECLRCERKPLGRMSCMLCDTPLRVTGCHKCFTLYAWRQVDGSDYRFLVPLNNEKILKTFFDPAGGHL